MQPGCAAKSGWVPEASPSCRERIDLLERLNVVPTNLRVLVASIVTLALVAVACGTDAGSDGSPTSAPTTSSPVDLDAAVLACQSLRAAVTRTQPTLGQA